MDEKNSVSTPLNMVMRHKLTGHNGAVFSVGPMEKEPYFFSAGGDGWVAQWDLHAPEVGRLVAKVETQLFSAIFLPRKNQMVLGNMNGGVHWVNLADPDSTQNIAHHQMGVFAFQQVDPFLYSVGGDGKLTRWDIETGRTVESLYLSNQSLRTIDFSTQRNELAVGASDHNIYLLDQTTLALKHTFKQAHSNSVFSVKYHPSQALLLSGGRDAHLRAWSLENYTAKKALPAHWYTINALQFSPDGHWLATSSRDKTIKIWDAQTLQLRKVLETVRDRGHVNSVNSLYWSSYQNLLISGSDDRTLIVWELVEP